MNSTGKIPMFNLKQKFISSVLILSGGIFWGQFVPFLLSPLLTRLYDAKAFATFGQFLSISNILSILVTGQFEYSVMLPGKDKSAKQLVFLTILISFINSILFFILLYVVGDQLIYRFHNPSLGRYLLIIPVSTLSWGILQAMTFWRTRKRNFKSVSLYKAVQGTASAIIQLGAWFIISNAGGIIFGRITGQIIGILTLLKGEKTKNIFGNMRDNLSLKRMTLLAYRYRKFPVYNIPAAFLNVLSVEITMFFLSIFFSVSIVGYYTLSQHFLIIPVSIIAAAVGEVLYKDAVHYKKENPNELPKFIKNIFISLFLIGVIPFSLLLTFGDYIFSFIWGVSWLYAGRFAQVISLWIFLILLGSPISRLFFVFEKQKEYFFFNLCAFILKFLALWYGCNFISEPWKAIIPFAAVSFLYRCAVIIYLLRLSGVKIINLILFTLSVLPVPIILFAIIRFSITHIA